MNEQTEWLSIEKDGKPNRDCQVRVCNIRRSNWSSFLAVYNKNEDVFIFDDSRLYVSPCLDVTHYHILPEVREIFKQNEETDV